MTLAVSVIGLILVSSFSIFNPSSYNQAFATIENNKFSDSIKKACLTYEGNGNINGLVSNVLKVCLNRGGVSEPSPGPNDPPYIPLPQNVALLDIGGLEEGHTYELTVSILQSAGRFYKVFESPYLTAFAIPVGLTYKIEMNDQHDPKKSFIFHNVDCIDVDSNSCILTMGTSVQWAQIHPLFPPN